MKRKADSSQRDMVGGVMNDLLVNTAHYITTGVPPHVLVSRVSQELAANAGESDVIKFQKRAKELIEREVKNETLVRFPSGNYLHGPKKAEAEQSAASGEESDSILLSAEEDEEEDEEEVDQSGQKDADYSPNYIPKNFSKKDMKRGEGRTSGRMKKSRFDADEYIFPTILKNLTKKSPTVQEKVKKRPGPKPKKKCPICTLYSTSSHRLKWSCKMCRVKAHSSCVETEMSATGKDPSQWVCSYCKPATKKWICAKCEDVAGKEKGILLSCENCRLKYHRACHSPPILMKHIRNSVVFRCSNCLQKPAAKKGVDSSYNMEESDDESNLDLTQRCYVCHNKFYNVANKLKCSECKYLFHARCCRVRTAENVARLGAKRSKWKCDDCMVAHAGLRQAGSCRVVLPRLQLKTERKSESSDESTLRKRSRRRPKKKMRQVEPKSPTVVDDSPDIGDEEDEVKEDTDAFKVFSPKEGKEWWAGRLKPIVVGNKQPSLGPIPDLSVPDISSWSGSKVEEYFNEYFLDKSVGQVFVDQDIDGKALKLMRRVDILRTFDDAGFKLDIVMDVMQHIKRLQLRVNDRRYIWADIF